VKHDQLTITEAAFSRQLG